MEASHIDLACDHNHTLRSDGDRYELLDEDVRIRLSPIAAVALTHRELYRDRSVRRYCDIAVDVGGQKLGERQDRVVVALRVRHTLAPEYRVEPAVPRHYVRVGGVKCTRLQPNRCPSRHLMRYVDTLACRVAKRNDVEAQG